MEGPATRRDGDPGPSSWRWTWTYKRHKQIRSAGAYTVSRSSRSGTIVSTASTSRPSLSTDDSESEIKIHEHLSWSERTKDKEQEKMKRVTEELVNGGVKRWFTELRVSLVFDVADAASAGELDVTDPSLRWFVHDAPQWIHALAEMVETIWSTSSTLALPDPCSRSHTGDDEEQAVPPNQFFLRRVTSKILQRVKSKLFLTNNLVTGHASGTDQITNNLVTGHASITADQIQFASFTHVAMSKMLVFVDFLGAQDLCRQYSFNGKPDIYCYHKSLNVLLDVHGAVSKALHVIEVQSIRREIFRLLSTKEEKALDAIWLTLNHTTTHLLKCIEDSSATQALQQGSSDIHKVTLSVIRHISFLMDNKLSLDLIISEAENCAKVRESRIGNQTHSDSNSMIVVIRVVVSRLQEKLAILSESFPDQGLGFLFLLNNSPRLHRCLVFEPGCSCLQLYAESLSTKVDGYMQSYLQVSWDPVLSCLFNPTPCFLGKNCSPLTRFESEFQKTYITQKQWKVSDPDVRKNLRTAIIEQIIPGYTKYIQENNITTPRLAPQELEEMLQDLFEG